jgi:hypothetical protein
LGKEQTERQGIPKVAAVLAAQMVLVVLVEHTAAAV